MPAKVLLRQPVDYKSFMFLTAALHVSEEALASWKLLLHVFPVEEAVGEASEDNYSHLYFIWPRESVVI